MRALLAVFVIGCTGQIDSGPGGPAPDTDAPVEQQPDAPAGAARLDVTFSTTTRGGQYAPRNVVVAWVENNGTFVRTVDRKSAVRTTHLIAWKTLATISDMDAVTGATRLDHNTPITLSWDLKDNGAEIPDGNYTLRMEMTEDNSTTTATNSEGSFTFVKGPNAQMQSGLSNNGFTGVTINFTP
jgi:hypothetical protein